MARDYRQQYMDARVDGAKTLADSYRHHTKNPEVFVAGVQYALDKMLNRLDQYTVGELLIEHMTAIDILERAKKGEPQ